MSNPLIHEEAERAVLGAVMIRNAAMDEIADTLDPVHFGKPQHEAIFAAMRALYVGGKAIDPLTLGTQLQAHGAMDDAMRVYVYDLDRGVPSSTNVAYYAAIVKEKATLRNLRTALRKTLAAVEGHDATGADVLADAEQAIYSIGASAVKSDWISGAELAAELYPLIQEIHHERRAMTGVSTGFSDLDTMTRGFQKADLVLVGARPSQGKTAFGIGVALRAAAHVPVAVFSIEMSRQGIGFREVIHEADVDGWRMMSGRLTDIEQRRVGEGLARLGELTIWLDESPSLNPLQARSRLRRLRSKVGHIGLVVIDYVQLMAPMPEDRRENKTNQVAGVSRALKILAREFNAPFLVLSQLHRVPENRRPTMADMRDSGALEQDADVVLLLHRPEVYEPKPENSGLAELIIGKQRNGPTGVIELTWRGEPMRFENRTRR